MGKMLVDADGRVVMFETFSKVAPPGFKLMRYSEYLAQYGTKMR